MKKSKTAKIAKHNCQIKKNQNQNKFLKHSINHKSQNKKSKLNLMNLGS